jgi:hypothetical protein
MESKYKYSDEDGASLRERIEDLAAARLEIARLRAAAAEVGASEALLPEEVEALQGAVELLGLHLPDDADARRYAFHLANLLAGRDVKPGNPAASFPEGAGPDEPSASAWAADRNAWPLGDVLCPDPECGIVGPLDGDGCCDCGTGWTHDADGNRRPGHVVTLRIHGDPKPETLTVLLDAVRKAYPRPATPEAAPEPAPLSEPAASLLGRLPMIQSQISDSDRPALEELRARGLARYDALGGSVWWPSSVASEPPAAAPLPDIDPSHGHYGDPVVMECAGEPGCGQVEHAVCFMCSTCEAHRYPNRSPRSHWLGGAAAPQGVGPTCPRCTSVDAAIAAGAWLVLPEPSTKEIDLREASSALLALAERVGQECRDATRAEVIEALGRAAPERARIAAPKAFTAPFCRWWHEETGEHYGPGLHPAAPPEMHDAAEAFEAGRRSTLAAPGAPHGGLAGSEAEEAALRRAVAAEARVVEREKTIASLRSQIERYIGKPEPKWDRSTYPQRGVAAKCDRCGDVHEARKRSTVASTGPGWENPGTLWGSEAADTGHAWRESYTVQLCERCEAALLSWWNGLATTWGPESLIRAREAWRTLGDALGYADIEISRARRTASPPPPGGPEPLAASINRMGKYKRLRVIDDEDTGPVLQAWVRNKDLQGWHWDWLQTLAHEEAAAWRAALASNSSSEPPGGPAEPRHEHRWVKSTAASPGPGSVCADCNAPWLPTGTPPGAEPGSYTAAHGPALGGFLDACAALGSQHLGDPDPAPPGDQGGEGCKHTTTERGPDIPLRYGSWRSEVCTDCGAWRCVGHSHPEPMGDWRTDDINERAKEDEEL